MDIVFILCMIEDSMIKRLREYLILKPFKDLIFQKNSQNNIGLHVCLVSLGKFVQKLSTNIIPGNTDTAKNQAYL